MMTNKAFTPSRKLAIAVCAVWLLHGASLAWGQQQRTRADAGQHVQKITSNRVLELLRAGKPAFGALMVLPSPPAAEILAKAGFDWLWIDMEHGPLNLETVHAMIQATSGTATVPIVRVPWNLHWLAKPVLDTGAMGIVMPFVNNKEEAEAAVRALRYPPEGVRGYLPTFAALRWGLSPGEYVKVANKEIMAVVLIESIEAVNRIDEILAVPGIDLAFVGPFDMSGTMGLLGQTTHPRVQEAIDKVAAAAKKAKVPLGTIATSREDIDRRLQQGFRFIMVAIDTALLSGGATSILGQIKR